VKRTSCAACGHTDLDQFLDLGMSPIADAYTATADEVSPTYPLQVAVCAKCRLVQLLEVVPANVLFGTGYSFYSSASAPLSAYHKAYADDVLARYPDRVRAGVVEIGCNDGDLLQHFGHVRHLGIDPSTGPVDVAAERGLNVAPEAFGLEVARDLVAEEFPAGPGVVIANHVLAHVEEVSDFLAGVAHLMGDHTVGFVEVQYLPDLIVNNAFDLVYHEHRNFFSLTSLEHAASRHGLYVVDAELTDRQGGSLRATLSHRNDLPTPIVSTIRRSELWLNSFGAYEGMQGRAERICMRLLDLLAEQSGPIAAYGAPAKLTTLLSFCGLNVSTVRWCVDSTPAKQGRFIPGTGIPIVAPSVTERAANQPSAYLLSAWNYARAIMSANPGNRWIVPIPGPVLL
jgi:hypothetical protein